MPSKQASEPQTNVPPPELTTDDEQGEVSNRPFWSGTISFGLVSIPVDLYPAVRRSRISMRMLSPDGVPLNRRYYSPESGKEVTPEHMTRGYQASAEDIVLVTDEELERLVPEKSRYIELRQFVEVQSVHPLYFDKAYFLAPSGESPRAYRLLATTMQKAKRAAVADFVMRGQAYPAAIFADNGILRLQTLRYHDELRTPEDVGLPAPNADETAVKAFRKLIAKGEVSKLDRKQLQDVAAKQMQDLIERKRKKNEDVFKVEEPERAMTGVVDILDTLKRSLVGMQKKEPEKKSPQRETKSGATSSRRARKKAK